MADAVRKNTKERVLEAALLLFSERGYDAVGVDEIAAQIGLKGPAIYRHFKGKEEVLTSLIQWGEAIYSEKMEQAAQKTKVPDSVEALVEISRQQVAYTMHDDMTVRFRRLLTQEQFRNASIAEISTNHFLLLLEERYTTIFAAMMEKGVLKKEDPKALAFAYVSPISQLIHWHDREPHREAEISDRLEAHYALFLKTYSAK